MNQSLIGSRLPRWLSGKESACQCRRCRRHGFDPWVEKIPWRRICILSCILVFFPGKSHGQRNLAGYRQWGCKEVDTTEYAYTHQAPTILKLASHSKLSAPHFRESRMGHGKKQFPMVSPFSHPD